MKVCARCQNEVVEAEWLCASCGHEPPKLNGFYAFAPDLAEANEGFEADYFANLALIEAGNFWFQSRNRLIVWALQRYFSEAKNFLEIGCGTGFVLAGIRQTFPALSLQGSEIFSAGLGFAAGRLPGVDLFQMDARRIPFRDEFDVIGAFDVLEHISADEEVLAQVHQAIRPGGGLLVTVPHHPFLWSAVDEYARHVRRYRTRELKEKIERAGFSVLRITSFVSLLLPLLIVSRFRKQEAGKQLDTSEVQVGRLANATLERILDFERMMIRAGLSLPAGGSLLVAAQRR